VTSTPSNPLPMELPTLEEALRDVSRGLGEVPPDEVVLDYDRIPETVKRIREARLKRELKEAEKKARAKARRAKPKRKLHYTQKKATKRRSNAKYHETTYHKTLAHRYSRWKRRSRTKAEGIGLTLEEFGFFWNRIDPKWGEPFYRVPERVKWERVDTALPWSLDNLTDYATIGRGKKKRRVLKWKTLDLATT
jgi:hypothetical protein